MLAIGTSAADAFVNPKMRGGMNLEQLKFRIYASGAGVKSIDNADQEYVERLLRLTRGIKRHGKYRILAFDQHYNADGTVDLKKTNMYVPNRYVVELAGKNPDVFTPVVSVHPYRHDALQELETWAKAGVKYVKWLPNAMGMDPANPAIEPFYRKMKEHNMILLSHAGEEQAVEAEENQRLGNPLLLRKPLDLGVRVIIAHAASLGNCDDIDNRAAVKASCFDLFLRMMDEAKYVGLLFGEISAMLQFNRMPVPFATLLKRQDLHSRLVNGSDYPLPAINSLIWTRSLVRSGFITAEERQSLNEIYDYNPLLFDFVLKRTMRHPETKQKLATSVFMENPGLEN
jgi:predicted TIM-barrel fold metal-dependent hydrolase